MVESRVCGGGGSFGCRPASAWRQKQAGGVPRPSAQLLPRSPGPRSAARAPSQAPELPGRHFVAANIGAHDVRLFSQERNAHFLTRRAGGAAGGPPATTFFPGMPEDGLLVPRPDRAFRLAPKYGEGGRRRVEMARYPLITYQRSSPTPFHPVRCCTSHHQKLQHPVSGLPCVDNASIARPELQLRPLPNPALREPPQGSRAQPAVTPFMHQSVPRPRDNSSSPQRPDPDPL